LRALRAFAADPRIYNNETGWAGAATTTWNYDASRDWLSGKRVNLTKQGNDTVPDDLQ